MTGPSHIFAMIHRSEALQLLSNYLENPKLRYHSFAVEAIMKNTAAWLDKDQQLWGLVGLVHDLDYEYTQQNPQTHGLVTAEILDGLLPDKAINAIKAHNYVHTDTIPTSSLDKALLASDALSGLIIATALVMPQKKLAEVTVESLKKKFTDSSFAKGCSRRRIMLCEDIGISRDDFLQLGLDSLQQVASTIGL